MTAIIFTKKRDLVAALESVRVTAKRIDAKHVRERAKEVDKAEKKLRANLKARKNWSYDKWRSVDFDVLSYDDRADRHCERSMESSLDAELGRLNLSKQERFSITHLGNKSKIWKLLNLNIPEEKSICDGPITKRLPRA